MRRTRHVIAVVVVATALCADRSVTAAPQPLKRAQPSAGFARNLASKITSSFRQVVAPVAMLSSCTGERAQVRPLAIGEAASGVRIELSPFQFRLPPPIC